MPQTAELTHRAATEQGNGKQTRWISGSAALEGRQPNACWTLSIPSPCRSQESEGVKGHQWGKGEDPPSGLGTSHWDVSFSHQGGQAFLQGCSSQHH